MYDTSQYQSPVGELTLASDGVAITGLWMKGQKYFGYTLAGECRSNDNAAVLALGKRWLDAYFAGRKPTLTGLPLAPVGGAFRQLVWAILMEIPYGEVRSYGAIAKEVARRMGKTSMSSQAVGGAVGHNPIGIIIPCHRVLGANGSLTGYAGGIDKKRALLRHEGVDMAGMFVPKRGTAL